MHPAQVTQTKENTCIGNWPLPHTTLYFNLAILADLTQKCESEGRQSLGY